MPELHWRRVRLPDTTLEVAVHGADHSLPITHPAEVAAAVGAFLREHPLGV